MAGAATQLSPSQPAEQEELSARARQAAQSHLAQPRGPGLARQLWQLLSPDWLRLASVTAFTLLSVVCTVSIGPAVGAGPPYMTPSVRDLLTSRGPEYLCAIHATSRS
jgi:hypothetical protein